eukprot:294954-Rhodomonas_salina.3
MLQLADAENITYSRLLAAAPELMLCCFDPGLSISQPPPPMTHPPGGMGTWGGQGGTRMGKRIGGSRWAVGDCPGGGRLCLKGDGPGHAGKTGERCSVGRRGRWGGSPVVLSPALPGPVAHLAALSPTAPLLAALLHAALPAVPLPA